MEALRQAVLHTKALRHMLVLQSKGGWANAATAAAVESNGATSPSGGGDNAAMAASLPQWQPSRACQFAVEAARHMQAVPVSSVSACARGEWSRLGGAMGKLLAQLYRAFAVEDMLHARDGAGKVSHSRALLHAAATLFIEEAAARRSLRRTATVATSPTVAAATANAAWAAAAAGGAGVSFVDAAALDELEAREAYGSTLPAQLAKLLELGAMDDAWTTGVDEDIAPVVRASVGFMGRTVLQLRQWSLDSESFACEVLLPPADDLDEEDEENGREYLDGDDAGSGDDDDSFKRHGGLGEDEDADDAGEDPYGEDEGGGGHVSDAGSGGATAGERLRRAAESLLTAWLCAAPEPVGAAMMEILPTSACAADEPLDVQIEREACYTALGLGAWQLQNSLSFAQLMTAVLSEDAALKAAAQLPARPPLATALQARLCWLLSCWWAFGSRGDVAEDERTCSASYTFLCQQLLAPTADLAVRLQAAHVLLNLIRSASAEDIPMIAPHAPHAFTGLATTLAHCRADDACLWTLRAITTLLRRLPGVAFTDEARASTIPVLEALWQRAEREQRTIVLRALRRVASAVSKGGAGAEDGVDEHERAAGGRYRVR